MRLLNIETMRFTEFYGNTIPSYVITSHRWTNDEASYKDIVKWKKPESKGHKKIEGFCAFVTKDNKLLRSHNPTWPPCDWVWIDTCCIDQRSSAEVSESINSMFRWYSQARECIAYLADVSPLSTGWDIVMDHFRRSEWFTRGWTLQELLAPRCVVFLNSVWEVIGHKCSFCSYKSPCAGAGPLLNQEIAKAAGIREDILSDYRQSENLSVEDKMKWMEHRSTTRTEDMAYCLLGLFDVNIPLLYGEGYKALLRLGAELDKAPDRRDTHESEPIETGTRGRSDDIVSGTGTLQLHHPPMPTSTSQSTETPEQRSKEVEPGRRIESTPDDDRITVPSAQLRMSSIFVRMIEESRSNSMLPALRRFETATANYECLYPPCTRVNFRRRADLERHMAAMHNRNALNMIDCEYPGCHRRGDNGFFRRDKVIEHMRDVHKANIPKRQPQKPITGLEDSSNKVERYWVADGMNVAERQ